MVGVPRSNGCQLCIRRRVKCDEARPVCGNCVKYGANCPGYGRSLKFVTGKHQVRQRSRRREHDESGSHSSSDDSNHPLPSILLVSHPSVRDLEPGRNHVLYIMMQRFDPSNCAPDLVRLFSWIRYDDLGKSALLDGAISSLALHMAAKADSNAHMVAHSRTLYGQSLSELQAALRHPAEWKSSETLFAAILLCYFELFAGTSAPDTWLQHAKGIGVLMEQRGPAAHASGWDAGMLLSFRGILIMGEMFHPSETDFLLSRREWKRAMLDRGRCLIHAPTTAAEVVNMLDRFFAILSEVPAILRKGYRIREANKCGLPLDLVRVSVLAQSAVENYVDFAQWHDDFVRLTDAPAEIAAPDPATSPFPTVLEYPHPWAGSMHMAYWASALILGETAAQCASPLPEWVEKRTSLVSNILRSAETVGKGVMGPYRVGYAMRIVYEFVDSATQRWIQALLAGFSQTYASVDPKTYPAPAEEKDVSASVAA